MLAAVRVASAAVPAVAREADANAVADAAADAVAMDAANTSATTVVFGADTDVL